MITERERAALSYLLTQGPVDVGLGTMDDDTVDVLHQLAMLGLAACTGDPGRLQWWPTGHGAAYLGLTIQ